MPDVAAVFACHIEVIASGAEDILTVGHPGGVMREDAGNSLHGAADCGDNPERLSGCGGEMAAQQPEGPVRGDVVQGGAASSSDRVKVSVSPSAISACASTARPFSISWK